MKTNNMKNETKINKEKTFPPYTTQIKEKQQNYIRIKQNNCQQKNYLGYGIRQTTKPFEVY